MSVAAKSDTRLQALAGVFAGALLRPGDPGYEEARKVHNGLVDRRPALIARCTGTADVVEALRFGRESELELAVRGGGHSVAGLSVSDGGVVIDLSALKGLHVDHRAGTVRAQAGTTWGELNRETGLFGLAVTGGVISTTGVAGLTLGGGVGWLMGCHGLAADNLLSVQLVTAAGEVVTASPHEHPDLFWAIRGGGGNFGIATWFEYRLRPLREVVGGLVAHPLADAREALRFYRAFVADAPDELTVYAALTHAPDGSGAPLAAFAICHAGDRPGAERDLRPLLDFGSPILSEVGPRPYAAVNTMLDDGFPAGALNYWKSSFLTALSDEAIDVLVEQFSECPSPTSQIAVEHFHGAVTRVGVPETAVPHREAGFNVLITSVWSDPAATDENVEWARDTYDVLRPLLSDRRYVNYLDRDDGNAARAAYGPNYARLSEVKRRYDPENIFRLNVNVPPADGQGPA